MTKLQRLIVSVLALVLTACAGLPPQSSQPQTFSLPDSEPTRLSAIFARDELSHPDNSARMVRLSGKSPAPSTCSGMLNRLIRSNS